MRALLHERIPSSGRIDLHLYLGNKSDSKSAFLPCSFFVCFLSRFR